MKVTEILTRSFKQLRTEHDITGRSLCKEFGRASTFFTKFEQNNIKEIGLDNMIAFITYCVNDEKRAIEIILENGKRLTNKTEDWMKELDNYYTEKYNQSYLLVIDSEKLKSLSIDDGITDNYEFGIKLNQIFIKLTNIQKQYPEYVNSKVDKLIDNMDVDVSFVLALLGVTLEGINKLDKEDKESVLMNIKTAIQNGINTSSRKVELYQ